MTIASRVILGIRLMRGASRRATTYLERFKQAKG
jgi:hypothetical protein